MALEYPILDFPKLSVKGQLFHVPGAALDGGYTTGGARMISPEPGGRSVLELQLSLQVNEWSNPFVSWLMSKINGEIFRVQLTKTPQIAEMPNSGTAVVNVPWSDEDNPRILPWDNEQFWTADGEFLEATLNALTGTEFLEINMNGNGEFLQPGHVIGVQDVAYIIDEIVYDGDIATIAIKPPLRTSVTVGEMIYMRPYFLGTISNAEEFRQMYDKEFEGHIQPGKLIFMEAIIS